MDDQNNSSEFVYGRRPVIEVLKSGKRSVHKLWIAEGSHGVEELLALTRAKGIPFVRATRSTLDRMIQGNHQGIVAQVSATAYLELDEFLRRLGPTTEALVLGLDEIEDPQNVGAILRNAGFFGVTAVIVPRWRSAPVGGTALRASSGAAEHVPIIRVRNLVDAIDQLKEANFEVIGADISGEELRPHARPTRTALILGSEGKGLRRLVKEHCDKLVGIPARSSIGSLNVASASAIFLYEFCRAASNK